MNNLEENKRNNRKVNFWSKTLNIFITLLVLGIMIIVGVLSYMQGLNDHNKNTIESQINENNLTPLIYDKIRKNYYRELSDQEWNKIKLNAAQGALLGLDPYSRIVPKNPLSGYSAFMDSDKKAGFFLKRNFYGEYCITDFFDKSKLQVTYVDTYYPKIAVEKELLRGDMLYEIKGVNFGDEWIKLEGTEMQYASLEMNKLKDSFNLRIKRVIDGKSVLIDFLVNKLVYENMDKIERDRTYVQVDESTVMIVLSNFTSEMVFRNFKEDVKRAKDDDKVKNVILDLRDNGGGDLKALQCVIKVILGDLPDDYMKLENERAVHNKTLINSKTVQQGININYSDIKSEDALIHKNDLKLLLFVNENTASASEALIGVLKNNKYNKGKLIGVIGRRTFGKGVAQTSIPLNNDFILYLTTHKYYCRKEDGTWDNINGEGYKPYLIKPFSENDVLIPINVETERYAKEVKDDYIIKKAKAAFDYVYFKSI